MTAKKTNTGYDFGVTEVWNYQLSCKKELGICQRECDCEAGVYYCHQKEVCHSITRIV